MSISSKDDIVFGNTSLSNILEDIYTNSKKKDTSIHDIMNSFMSSMKGGKDIALIGPVIKDLLDVGVKNDEQLVKVATIIQRIINAGPGSEDDALGLTDQMKEELLKTVQDIDDNNKESDTKLDEIKKQMEDLSYGAENDVSIKP